MKTLRGFVLVLALSGAAMAASPIVLNDNGGWCWFQDDRVIVHDGKLYAGSVANRTGADGEARAGNIEIVQYDLEAGGEPTRFVLHEHLQDDDHDVPALLVLPDGRILAVYATHGRDALIRRRITERPGDITAWEPEKQVERPAGVTYSNLFRLSAENDGRGRIYDFYRGEDIDPNFVISDDDGQTWSYGGRLVTFRGRPYVKYASNNQDVIHFLTTEAHPRDYDNSIYHGYLEGGVIHRSDGTPVRSIQEGPVRPDELTCVYKGDANHVGWTTDMHLDRDGRPYIAFSVQIGDGDKPGPRAHGGDHRYFHGRWDGAQWVVHEMAYAGTCLYHPEEDYTGLVALDPRAPDEVYISTNAVPTTGEPLVSAGDGKRHHELFQGMTQDGGTTWTWTPITKDSTVDNLRPIVPITAEGQTLLLWTRGDFTTYTHYDLQVVMLATAGG